MHGPRHGIGASVADPETPIVLPEKMPEPEEEPERKRSDEPEPEPEKRGTR